MAAWDIEKDLVVIGSGAASMAAALTASVEGLETLVLEKQQYWGGSTAISGGGIWIPNSHLMHERGYHDSEEEVRTYFRHTVGERVPQEKQEAFIRRAPEMLRYFTCLPHMKFRITDGFCDYYPERLGGSQGGRSMEAEAFSGALLGKVFDEMHPPRFRIPMELVVGSVNEGKVISTLVAHPGRINRLATFFTRNLYGKLTGKRYVGMGAALACRLRMELLERKVPLWLNANVQELVMESGAVTGVVVRHEGKTVTIRARRGVVLAAGGFEWNQALRERYQKGPVNSSWSAGSHGNTGEILQMAIDRGAAVDLMDDSWGMPVIFLLGQSWPLVLDRCYPGSLIVNGNGERFLNEACPYVDYDHTTRELALQGQPTIPAFFIMDSRNRNRYMYLTVPPVVFPKTALEKGEMVKAHSLEELARKMGINEQGLLATVQRFNRFAQSGKDEDFQRGDSAYDRYYGDPSHQPNPCLGSLTEPPFYGTRLYPGDIGTKGGVVTNENAQVLDTQGNWITGLYAAGNNSASVMGNSYPGPGSTLGPALTFGYVAARHAAGRLIRSS